MKLKLLIGMIFLYACNTQTENKRLPILGEKQLQTKIIAGKERTDTLYHTIAKFQFVNQDSVWVSDKTFEGKIYVADFFFVSCPSICLVMSKQMARVYEKFKAHPKVLFLSHTINPEQDSVSVLKKYAQKYKADGKKWHFVTGNKKAIYEMGLKSYLLTAGEDKTAPGGFLHSGAFILVDGKKHIRGVYDGTDTESVNQLIADIELLLKAPILGIYYRDCHHIDNLSNRTAQLQDMNRFTHSQ